MARRRAIDEPSSRRSVQAARVPGILLVISGLWTAPHILAQPPPTSAEVARLVAATTDTMMYRIAVDGETAVIGLPFDDRQGKRSGTAYVYIRKGERWERQKQLLASNGQTEDQFGFSVAVHGDTVAIGAAAADGLRGSVHVFVRSRDDWPLQATLLGGDSSQLFGSWVVVGDDVILVGATDRSTPERGADVTAASRKDVAYLFMRTGKDWTQQAQVFGMTTPNFGNSADDLELQESRLYEREKNKNAQLFMRGGPRWSVYVKGCLLGADARGVWLRSDDGQLLFVPHSEASGAGGISLSGRCSGE